MHGACHAPHVVEERRFDRSDLVLGAFHHAEQRIDRNARDNGTVLPLEIEQIAALVGVGALGAEVRDAQGPGF
jgi:hypothetical protein